MRIKSLGLVTLLMLSATIQTGCNSSLPPIDTAHKSIAKHGNYFFVTGHWKQTERKGLAKLARVNTVDITCDKDTMTCRENFACLYAKGEDETATVNSLSMGSIDYKIVEWSADNTIRAVYNAPVADIEIKISLKDNFAERSFRETSARGNDTASPDVYSHWILE